MKTQNVNEFGSLRFMVQSMKQSHHLTPPAIECKDESSYRPVVTDEWYTVGTPIHTTGHAIEIS